MKLLHSCYQVKSSCVRCRACDATRSRHDVADRVIRVCAHCDGPTAVRLVSLRRRSP